MSTYLYGAFDCMFLCHVHLSEYIAPVSSKEFPEIQANTECGFTLKRVRDMIRTYCQRGVV